MSILNDLQKPTPLSEVKYRVGSIYDKNNGKAKVLSYVDARYVQDTLDNIIGAENWESRFYEAKGALFCEITIDIEGKKISKSDCGTESDIAPAKGEASDAFKRAAVMFGIGRDLYSAETMFADLEKKGSKWVLPRGWKPSNKASKPKQQKDKPKTIPPVNLKDQEVPNPHYDKVVNELGGIPLGDGESDDEWNGLEVVKFGKYRNNSGDKSNDITWAGLPIDYLQASWWDTMNSEGLKNKCKLELKRRSK